MKRKALWTSTATPAGVLAFTGAISTGASSVKAVGW